MPPAATILRAIAMLHGDVVTATAVFPHNIQDAQRSSDAYISRRRRQRRQRLDGQSDGDSQTLDGSNSRRSTSTYAHSDDDDDDGDDETSSSRVSHAGGGGSGGRAEEEEEEDTAALVDAATRRVYGSMQDRRLFTLDHHHQRSRKQQQQQQQRQGYGTGVTSTTTTTLPAVPGAIGGGSGGGGSTMGHPGVLHPSFAVAPAGNHPPFRGFVPQWTAEGGGERVWAAKLAQRTAMLANFNEHAREGAEKPPELDTGKL